jgi:hypothetical protein
MRHIAFRTAAVLALLSAGQLQAAQVAKTSCMTRGELRGMLTYFMPSVLDSTIAKCKDRLDADSYLIGQAPKLVDTLRAGQAAAWPDAKRAISKFGEGSRDTAMLDVLPEPVMRPMLEAMVEERLGSSIKPDSCGDISRIMGTLQPLPTANMIEFMAEALTVIARNEAKMTVCAEQT